MDHVTENAAARLRILTLVDQLNDEQLAAPLGDGWTLGALLGHLAFWDRVHVGRLHTALDTGADLPTPLGPGLPDAINGAGLPIWAELPGGAAVLLFAEASSEADAYVATLDAATVERVRAAGLARTVERFRHRTEHGDVIEAALRRQ